MRLLRTWVHQIEYTEILDFYRNGIIINNLASGSFYNASSVPEVFDYIHLQYYFQWKMRSDLQPGSTQRFRSVG